MTFTREKFRRLAPPGDDYLLRRIEALEREVGQTRSARRLETSADFAENNAMSLPTTWTDLGHVTVSVPPTFQAGNFIMFVSAGDSFSGLGNVSVTPYARFVGPTASAEYFGSAINSGNLSAAVATGFWALPFSVGVTSVGATEIQFGLYGIRTGTELTATSGNWHVAASANLLRG